MIPLASGEKHKMSGLTLSVIVTSQDTKQLG